MDEKIETKEKDNLLFTTFKKIIILCIILISGGIILNIVGWLMLG